MKIPVHLKSMITANPEAHHVQGPRKHHGKKAPKGASEETGGIEKKIKKWIPKRDTLAKPNL
jgi:hypothetical protein